MCCCSRRRRARGPRCSRAAAPVCNLTTTLKPDEAGRLFGLKGERFLRRALRTLTPLDVRSRFHDLGVPTVEAPLEKVFPASNRARDVRDALESWARGAGAEIRLGAEVAGIEPAGSSWRVHLKDSDSIECSLLLLCPGGRSVPRTGTTGDGYRWLAGLDLPIVDPVPALVPLTSPATWVHELAGVALQDVHARLVESHGKVLGQRARPIVFTHHGVSGPGAMDLAEPAARGVPGLFLELDLIPHVEREELRARLVEAAGLPGAPRVVNALQRLVPDAPPRRVLTQAAAQAGCSEENPRVIDLSKSSRHELIEAMKGLRVPIDGTLGFDKAEVTAGGLDLRAIDPGSMRVKSHPGLFVFGELLDLTGPIGGLNFQAAFATAELAARALG